MPLVTVIIGGLLILLGVLTSLLDIVINGGLSSPTSFIPSAFGVILAILGGIVMFKDSHKVRMIVMHIAVVIGVLGVIAPFGRIIPVMIKGGDLPSGLPLIGMAGLILLSLIYVVLCVRSFIQARSSKENIPS